jgi:hypothetical protein
MTIQDALLAQQVPAQSNEAVKVDATGILAPLLDKTDPAGGTTFRQDTELAVNGSYRSLQVVIPAEARRLVGSFTRRTPRRW